jgi:hypothetical protein
MNTLDRIVDDAEADEERRQIARLLARLNRRDMSVTGQGYRRCQRSRQSKTRR